MVAGEETRVLDNAVLSEARALADMLCCEASEAPPPPTASDAPPPPTEGSEEATEVCEPCPEGEAPEGPDWVPCTLVSGCILEAWHRGMCVFPELTGRRERVKKVQHEAEPAPPAKEIIKRAREEGLSLIHI